MWLAVTCVVILIDEWIFLEILAWNNNTGKLESGTPPRVHHIVEDLNTDW